MNYRYYIWLLIVVPIAVVFCSFSLVYAQPISFIDGIWLNQDTIATNDTVRVYVALRNSTNRDITGTLHLYANDVHIDSTPVAALPGRLIESWVDWQPRQAGSYRLVATIENISPATQGDDFDTPTLSLPRVVVSEPLPAVATTTESNETGPVTETIDSELEERFANQGFEQFIPNSLPRRWLETATNQIQSIQNELTNYQTRLLTERETASSTSSDIEVESQTVAQETPINATTTIGAMVFSPILDWFKTNLTNLYIHTIGALRWLFSHPILIQILFLLILLWFIYRTARYIGKP